MLVEYQGSGKRISAALIFYQLHYVLHIFYGDWMRLFHGILIDFRWTVGQHIFTVQRILTNVLFFCYDTREDDLHFQVLNAINQLIIILTSTAITCNIINNTLIDPQADCQEKVGVEEKDEMYF